MGNYFRGNRNKQIIQQNNLQHDIQNYSHIKAIAINSPQNFTSEDSKYNFIETINFHLGFRNLNDQEIIHIANLLYILPQTLRVANFMMQSNKVTEKGWSYFFSRLKDMSSLSQLSLSLNNNDSLNLQLSNFKTLGKSLPKSLNLIYLNLNTTQINLKYVEEFLKEATQKPNLNSIRLLANQLVEDYNGQFFEKFHTWFLKSSVNEIYFYLSFQTINNYDVATSFEKFFANIPSHLQMIKLQIRINLTAEAYASITQVINNLMSKINGKNLMIFQLEILGKQQDDEFKSQIASIKNILLALHNSNLRFFQLVTQFGHFTFKDSKLEITNFSCNELQKSDIYETALSTRLSFDFQQIPQFMNILNQQKIILINQIATYYKLIQPTLFSYSKSYQMKYNCWDLHF
ncbi:hypothetical protein ABPG72_011560 [Tetrahymena utriculariae]